MHITGIDPHIAYRVILNIYLFLILCLQLTTYFWLDNTQVCQALSRLLKCVVEK